MTTVGVPSAIDGGFEYVSTMTKLVIFPRAPFKARPRRTNSYVGDRALAGVAIGVGGAGAGLLERLLREPYPLIAFLFFAWAVAASCLATKAHDAGLVRYAISLSIAVSILAAVSFGLV